MIHNIYFMQYNKNQEEKDGEYWLYTELSNEEIHKSGLYEPNICKTILQIQNPILKEKMKEKLNSYIKEYGIVNTSFESCIASRLYSDEEIISIIQNDNFLNNLNNLEDNNIQTIISSITTYINICNMVKDEEFINQEINKIINIVKDKKDKDKIIITTLTFLEKINKKDLHNNIVNEYKEIIPDVYNKYLIINSNSNYLYNKSLEYNQNELKIGIDPNIKIGVEIETNNDNKLIIDFYNQNKFKGLYRSDDDATVPNGIEVTSKPFNDTIDDISKFRSVCDTLSEIGYHYDEETYNAAGQINLGLEYLDSAKSILTFYEIFCNVEELLFYISNGNNQLTRQGLNSNSRFNPISGIINARTIDEDISRDEVIKMFNIKLNGRDNEALEGLEYKKNTLCLRGEYEENYRFEIRIPNGGNDFNIWKDNIRLYGKMMEKSKVIASLLNKDYLNNEEQNLLKLKIDLENENLSLDEKLFILMDLLFEDKSIKKIYYERFINTIKKIKETNSDKYIPRYSYDGKTFSKVEFEEKYNSKINDEPTVSYDPETNTYIENGKIQKI